MIAPAINLWSAFGSLDTSTRAWIIILFVVSILAFSFGLGLILRESSVRRYRSTFPWATDGELKKIDGIEYYATRKDLRGTLNDELGKSEKVLALWHGGKQADVGLYEKRILGRYCGLHQS